MLIDVMQIPGQTGRTGAIRAGAFSDGDDGPMSLTSSTPSLAPETWTPDTESG